MACHHIPTFDTVIPRTCVSASILWMYVTVDDRCGSGAGVGGPLTSGAGGGGGWKGGCKGYSLIF